MLYALDKNGSIRPAGASAPEVCNTSRPMPHSTTGSGIQLEVKNGWLPCLEKGCLLEAVDVELVPIPEEGKWEVHYFCPAGHRNVLTPTIKKPEQPPKKQETAQKNAPNKTTRGNLLE